MTTGMMNASEVPSTALTKVVLITSSMQSRVVDGSVNAFIRWVLRPCVSGLSTHEQRTGRAVAAADCTLALVLLRHSNT